MLLQSFLGVWNYEYSNEAKIIMAKMGYISGGLGKNGLGIIDPISPIGQNDRIGLGMPIF